MIRSLDILPSRSANLGIFTLNRPSALNALSLDMIRTLNTILPQFQSDPSIKATLFEGCCSTSSKKLTHGEIKSKPCFCAGGDVKAVYVAGQEGKALTVDFFREEYQLNNLIATQSEKCPQISIWDGVVMGGGVGISIHGKYRIATENTLFAMPETAIGLFPDVGSMYWLPRLKGGIGNYLALTGARLKADDLMYSELATHYIPSEKIPGFRTALIQATVTNDNDDENKEQRDPSEDIAHVLSKFSENIDTSNSFLAKNKSHIDRSFEDKETIEDIVASLESINEAFEKKTLEVLKAMSPTSLKVTLEAMKRGKAMKDVASSLVMEYRMSQAFMRNDSDFYEGIRAMLVDKDNAPKWSPNSIEDVSDERVASFFESLSPDHELTFPNQSMHPAKL